VGHRKKQNPGFFENPGFFQEIRPTGSLHYFPAVEIFHKIAPAILFFIFLCAADAACGQEACGVYVCASFSCAF
jgi:hypothetical protein